MVRDVVTARGWSDEGISEESLARLRPEMIEAGHVDELALPGLSDERRPVFPGGVAIFPATFEALAIERLRGSKSALREGLLYDLLGRIHQEDVRRLLRWAAPLHEIGLAISYSAHHTHGGYLPRTSTCRASPAASSAASRSWYGVTCRLRLVCPHRGTTSGPTVTPGVVYIVVLRRRS